MQLHGLTALNDSSSSFRAKSRSLPGSRGLPSGSSTQHRCFSLKLRRFTQATSQTTREQPGKAPPAHHKPSPGPTRSGSPRVRWLPGATPQLSPQDRGSTAGWGGGLPSAPQPAVPAPLPATYPAPPAPAPAPPRNPRPWRPAPVETGRPPPSTRHSDWLLPVTASGGPAAALLLAAGRGACAPQPRGAGRAEQAAGRGRSVSCSEPVKQRQWSQRCALRSCWVWRRRPPRAVPQGPARALPKPRRWRGKHRGRVLEAPVQGHARSAQRGVGRAGFVVRCHRGCLLQARARKSRPVLRACSTHGMRSLAQIRHSDRVLCAGGSWSRPRTCTWTL